MFLGDDDEIQKVDSTYLGPPGKYLGRIRYRVAGLFVILLPVLLFLVDRFIGIGFWSVVWTFVGAMMLSGVIADRVTTHRPITGTLRMSSGELFTPRRIESKEKAVRGPSRIRVRKLDLHTTVSRPERVREL